MSATGERFQTKPRAQDLGDLARQDRAPAGTTARCRRTIRSSAGPARGPRSSPGAIAIRRAWRCIPRPAGSGRSSTGRSGGDELNILKAGANYGWPQAHRRHQLRRQRSSAHTRACRGMEDPLRTWVPSISPCGLMLLHRRQVPGLEGIAVHRRAVGQCAVPHRGRRRALRRRGAVDRGPASLYPRRSPGARRAALSRHPQRRWRPLPPRARVSVFIASAMPAPSLILASASPSRRQLLANAGLVFTIEPSGSRRGRGEAQPRQPRGAAGDRLDAGGDEGREGLGAASRRPWWSAPIRPSPATAGCSTSRPTSPPRASSCRPCAARRTSCSPRSWWRAAARGCGTGANGRGSPCGS